MNIEPKSKKTKTFNFRSWLISTLRRASYRWPARSECLKKYRVSRGLYNCNECKLQFPKKEIRVDHINPIIDIKVGFTSWDDFINGLFCSVENLQVLCLNCNKVKTHLENQMRKEYRKINKDIVKNNK